MGYHRFIQALLQNEPVMVYGDGRQARGNTYVADCVDATVAAADAPVGEVYNIGGGESASVWDILAMLEQLSGRRAQLRHEAARPGDQRQTLADTAKIQRHLGWQPRTPLRAGLAQQFAWQERMLAAS
jgi:nucleoside-diphosphate-sugar epimerase